jgi:DNA-binding NarL/FixJ family response regulator
MSRVRVVLVDDHTVIRAGLRALLERHPDIEVVGEASDGREAISIAESLKPEILIMDVAMSGMNGIEATRQIVAKNLGVSVVILSMHSDESYVLRALKAGARGYLLKDSAEADLINAIRSMREGKSYFSPAVSRILLEDYVRTLRHRGEEDSYELLTAREREVLQLIAEGRSNKDVAAVLNLSLYTVETHRTHIMQKLNLHTVPELILYAVRKGIVS